MRMIMALYERRRNLNQCHSYVAGSHVQFRRIRSHQIVIVFAQATIDAAPNQCPEAPTANKPNATDTTLTHLCDGSYLHAC